MLVVKRGPQRRIAVPAGSAGHIRRAASRQRHLPRRLQHQPTARRVSKGNRRIPGRGHRQPQRNLRQPQTGRVGGASQRRRNSDGQVPPGVPQQAHDALTPTASHQSTENRNGRQTAESVGAATHVVLDATRAGSNTHPTGQPESSPAQVDVSMTISAHCSSRSYPNGLAAQRSVLAIVTAVVYIAQALNSFQMSPRPPKWRAELSSKLTSRTPADSTS